jgi:hypothetical protein
MQKTTRQPLFDLGQLVATPGALAAREKTGQNAMEFFRAISEAIGANCPKKTKPKTSSAWNADSGFSAAIGPRRATSYG